MDRKIILDFATKKHEGQFRKKSGLPYITHPIVVANQAERYAGTRDFKDKLWTVGICHDLFEDTDCTAEELGIILSLAGFDLKDSSAIIHSVTLLTKTPGYDIVRYILNISQDYLACRVKLCDLDHNSSDLEPGNLLDKYKILRYILNTNPYG